MIPIKTENQIEGMRHSARILVKAFQEIEKAVGPNIETRELERIADETIRKEGGRPAFKGYRGYPASICVSIDSEVVHGFPGKRKLENGQIVSIDIGVEAGGFFSDAAKTYPIGNVPQGVALLVQTTLEALGKGIDKCRAGNKLSDISHAIQNHAEGKGFSVVRDMVGHGIGRELHEEPQIANYGPPHRGPLLKPGMVFAVEPMINLGSWEVKVLRDGWTVQAVDGLPSAHFEHTIVITEGEPEVLTKGIDRS
jgi:methionyl aminopeptidase